MKKLIVLGTIVLFVGLCFIPSTVGIIEHKTIFTKSISGGYIQNLINNASDGDTIFIPSGIYYENIIINKSISLVGEDKDTTIIDCDGVGDVVKIQADWVNISRFTIRNSSYYQAGINIISNNTTIIDNIILNNGNEGIKLWGFIKYTINNNIISGNTIINNEYGIMIHGGNYGSSNNNTVIGNNISNNGFGINLGGAYNTIIGNTISSNNYNGIDLNGDSNIIRDNTITSNKRIGIFSNSCTNNTILQNNFLDNTLHTCFLYVYTFLYKINISPEEVLKNTWRHNYWGRPHVLPKRIPGIVLITILLEPLPSPRVIIIPIPWFYFDWRPAKEPYDI